MSGRLVAAGRRRPAATLPVMCVLLLCGAAALAWGASPQTAVPRQIPEEKLFSTASQPQLRAFIYSPKPPGTPRPDSLPVIFYSGEFGWRPLQQDVASYLASTGRFVLGIDSMEYFASPVSPATQAADQQKFRAVLNERAGRPKDADVILIGFAFGAKIIPYLLGETTVPGVRGAVLIAPDTKGFKVFRVAVQLKMQSAPEESFDVGEEIRKMPPIPLVLMEGTLDKDSAARALAELPRGPHKYVQVEGGDRQFHEVRDGFFAVLSEGLRWIDRTTVPPGPASAAPSAPAPPAPDPKATPRAVP